MLVRTWSRDSIEIFKQNPTKTWHYILAPLTPRPQQNQRVMSCTKARTVEDGFDVATVGVAATSAILFVCQLLTLPIGIGFLSYSYRHFFGRT
jgi:hypothetical protein